MSVVILIIGLQVPSGTIRCRESGQYVVAFDPDAMAGFGTFQVCANLAEAKHFPSVVEAAEAWRAQSRVRPLRDDGEPNRPLTADTVELVTVPA